MTYRQQHDLLLKLVNEKWQIYEEKDKEVFGIQGSAPINLLTDVQKAYSEWQQVSNDANRFLRVFKDSGKHPDDDI
jgi:hypothetical protein